MTSRGRWNCPRCEQPLGSARQRLATVYSPAACGGCGVYLAAKPGFGWSLLYGVASEVTWISGAIAAVLLGSWWPLIAGFVIGAFGWHWLLLWLTPPSVITPAEASRARRGWWLTIFWLAAAVILVGLIAGP